MKAIILAAGIGSRLKPITDKKPKCMVIVAGRPILDYQVSAYISAGSSWPWMDIVVSYRGVGLVGWWLLVGWLVDLVGAFDWFCCLL